MALLYLEKSKIQLDFSVFLDFCSTLNSELAFYGRQCSSFLCKETPKKNAKRLVIFKNYSLLHVRRQTIKSQRGARSLVNVGYDHVKCKRE